MKVKLVKAPVFTAQPFSPNPEDWDEFDRQLKSCEEFYVDLMNKSTAIEWTGNSGRCQYVFSANTIPDEGRFRISVFDKFGAVRHQFATTLKELYKKEMTSFPSHGEMLTVVL